MTIRQRIAALLRKLATKLDPPAKLTTSGGGGGPPEPP